MTAIDPAILDVAAVVLGEQRIALRGWQKRAAVEAMTALGHSRSHIAWALNTTKATIDSYGYIHAIALNTHDQRPDWTAINMVVTGQARMHLTGIDRDEAIRRMVANGDHASAIADRLLVRHSTITCIAARLGVTLPAAPDDDTWNWYAYIRRYDTPRQAVAA